MEQTDVLEYLYDTKVTPPPMRRGQASRRELIRAARESGRTHVAVTAPAGYGKSTLVAEWADSEERRVAWVSLDSLDDDPAALLALIAAAFERISPSSSEAIGRMRWQEGSALSRSAPLLASVLARADAPFLLVIDDLHVLSSPACHDVLDVVLDGVPAGSQCVVTSRHEQPYAARRRVDGRLYEITTAQLGLDVAAAAVIFRREQVDASDEELAELVARTEGWASGLVLAALVARYEGDVLAITGEDRFVHDYLYRELLEKVPVEVQDFLVRTSVLTRMSGPLCDALLGRSDSQAMLRTLEERSAFLIPLDRRRTGWFRYHELFREFLLAELRRRDPALVAPLHLRAADWFGASGDPARAIEHALAAGDRGRSARLLTQAALPGYQSGRFSTVSRWMDLVGDEVIESIPPLAVLAAWTAVLNGDVAGAERWADLLGRLDPGEDPDGVDLPFVGGRALLAVAMLRDGPDTGMSDAMTALQTVPVWSSWRDLALCLFGEMCLLEGRTEEADRAFAEASEIATRRRNFVRLALVESERAGIAIEDGRWDNAASRVVVALRAVEEGHIEDYAIASLAWAVGARVALHQGDEAKARERLAQAMRTRALSTYVLPFIAVRVRLHIAKALLASGDRDGSAQSVEEISGIEVHRPRLGRLGDQVRSLRERLDMASVAGSRLTPLTPAELRLLPYLQTHLTLAEIGQRLYLSRNTVSSETASIYRKLQVTTRGAAVDRAMALGLLGA